MSPTGGSESDDRVRVMAHEAVYRGHFGIDRYRLRHRLHAGGMSRELVREVFERGHSVAVLPYDPVRDAIVLIEQFRIGAFAAGREPWLIEIPAGVIEAGETPANVALRETREEIGCPVGPLIEIATFLPSPGGSSETVTLYCGRVDTTGVGGMQGVPDEGEDIRVFVRPWRDVPRLLAERRVDNGAMIIALQWLALNRTGLRRRWRRGATTRKPA